MIFSIEEEGQTALGGALLVSVELAKRAPGSKVRYCMQLVYMHVLICIKQYVYR